LIIGSSIARSEPIDNFFLLYPQSCIQLRNLSETTRDTRPFSMPTTYIAFGLTIASSIELPPLRKSPVTTIDVTIEYGKVSRDGLEKPEVVKPFSQTAANELWLHIPEVAWFYVSHGNRIVIDAEADSDLQTIRLFLLGSCLGAILHQRNCLVIHGNAIRFGDECVIFAGNSGNGKSTLAAAFYQRGYKVLADDLAVVDEQLRVQPSYPQLKLWHDSAKKLNIDTDQLKQIRHQINKYAYPIKKGFCTTPLPVRALYILNTHNEESFELEPIQGVAKFNPLKNNTYRLGYLEGLGLKPTHLKQCAELANRIKLSRITRPDRDFQIEKLVEMIEHDLETTAPVA